MLKTSCIFALVALSLFQISIAIPTIEAEPIQNAIPTTFEISQRGIVSDVLQELVYNLDVLVTEVFDNVAKVTTDITTGLGKVLVALTKEIEAVTKGTLNLISEAIRIKSELLLRFRDALMRPALSKAKLSLERLEKAVSMAIDDARLKFENAIQEMNDDAVGILNSITEKIQEETEEIKTNIGGLLLQQMFDDSARQCLRDQLAAVKVLANSTINDANSCIRRQLFGANDLSDNLGAIFDEAFEGVQELVDELNDCTDKLPARMSFRERKESAKCMQKVALNIQLAAARVSTDVGIKVGEALRNVVELRLDLGKCSSDNLNKWESRLEEINDVVENCIV